jgi:HEAT repeats
MRREPGTILLLCALAIVATAQQPQVSNTTFTSESVGVGLSRVVDRFQHSDEPRWVGYEVPALPGAHLPSCSGWTKSEAGCCGEYQLEETDNDISNHHADNSSTANLDVLMRFDHGTIIKIRTTMAGCHLNAGGVPFTWLTGVKPEESAAFLGQLAMGSTENGSSQITDGALAALALHATPTATRVLGEFTSSNRDFKLREKAAFWLGVERGHDGFAILQKLVREDSDSRFREKLTFDLSQSSDPEAIDELIRIAKSDSETQVRGQALFWLAQKAGKKAAAAISFAVENDPELAVKKKAVFALSQMPKDESIPKLIHLAETNPNPAVKKEAIFWLGQSNDPRALQYLEEMLKH